MNIGKGRKSIGRMIDWEGKRNEEMRSEEDWEEDRSEEERKRRR